MESDCERARSAMLVLKIKFIREFMHQSYDRTVHTTVQYSTDYSRGQGRARDFPAVCIARHSRAGAYYEPFSFSNAS